MKPQAFPSSFRSEYISSSAIASFRRSFHDSDSINIWADTFANCPNLTIYGYEGASPEKYAKKYNLTFKVIGSDLPCKGDINGDSEVSVEDAQLILLYYVQNTVSGIPTAWEALLGKE